MMAFKSLVIVWSGFSPSSRAVGVFAGRPAAPFPGGRPLLTSGGTMAPRVTTSTSSSGELARAAAARQHSRINLRRRRLNIAHEGQDRGPTNLQAFERRRRLWGNGQATASLHVVCNLRPGAGQPGLREMRSPLQTPFAQLSLTNKRQISPTVFSQNLLKTAVFLSLLSTGAVSLYASRWSAERRLGHVTQQHLFGCI